jgi:hypothetical protein
MEKPAQAGVAVLGELRADRPGLCCFELSSHLPLPTPVRVPIRAEVRQARTPRTRLLVLPFPPESLTRD